MGTDGTFAEFLYLREAGRSTLPGDVTGFESTFGKYTNATWGSYNAFGWTGGQSWTNWTQGISAVGYGIANNQFYFRAHYFDTASIYKTYCGANCSTHNLNTFLTEQGGDPGNVTCH